MPNISGYTARTTVVPGDRLFIAPPPGSDIVDSCTVEQLLAAGGAGGPTYAPGWGNFRSTGSWNRPALSSLTQFGTSSTYTDIAGGPIQASIPGGTAYSGLSMSVAGETSWTASALMDFDWTEEEQTWLGLFVANITTGNFIEVGIYASSGAVYANKWSGFNAPVASIGDNIGALTIKKTGPYAFRIRLAGGALTFLYSADGLNDAAYKSVASDVLSDYLGGEADVVGVGGSPGAFAFRLWGLNVTSP